MKNHFLTIFVTTILILLYYPDLQSKEFSYHSKITVSEKNAVIQSNVVADTVMDFQSTGDYIRYSKSDNLVDFQCTNAYVRIELCASDIFRIRMNPNGKFKPNEPFVVIKYDWPSTEYRVKDKGKYIGIETQRMLIKAFKSPFHLEFFDIDGNPVNKDWTDGSMGFRGDEVICRKELTATDHFFGLGQRYPMQGTQDSHAKGKNIYGEMMGCINLGISGIPFRTFTDNVSRELNYEALLSRLSQYLALTVAGSMPLYYRSDASMGDIEQFIPELYRNIAGYPDLYVLGAYGKGRKQVQILNRKDDCCFGQQQHNPQRDYDIDLRTFEGSVKDKLKKLEAEDHYYLMIDESATNHQISEYALNDMILKRTN